MELKIKALSPMIGQQVPAPFYASSGAAGMDLCACIEDPIVLLPGSSCSVPTGLAIALPPSSVGLIFARSGLATKYGIALSNSVGVIDSDYRGELKIGLRNFSSAPYTIRCGDRIAQLVVIPFLPCVPVFTDVLDETVRGSGGFGSTGR